MAKLKASGAIKLETCVNPEIYGCLNFMTADNMQTGKR